MITNHHATAGLVHDRRATLTAGADHARLVREAKAARRAQRTTTAGRYRRVLSRLGGLRVTRPQALPLPVAGVVVADTPTA